MKFKVGDIVRFERDWQKGIGNIVSIGSHAEESYLVNSEDIVEGHDGIYQDNLQNNENNYWFRKRHLELVEETSNYITTKDFIKEVEKLGYEVEDSYTGEYFNIISNQRVIIKIRKDKVNVITTNYTFPISGDLFDLAVKYAKTPIEFRGEPKKYTLQCPLTGAYLCINSTTSNNTVWLHKNNFKVNKEGIPKYTQEEIYDLPNQEFIKQLLKEEIENE